jgi:hypothetical protein
MSLSSTEVDRMVAELRSVEQRSSWDHVFQVGRIVFDGVASGNECEWRKPSRSKGTSLRQLAQHPACPLKKSGLCSSVNVFLFARAHPSVRELPGISPTHVGQVVRLKVSDAADLLSKASSNGWSVRELGRHASALLRRSGERRGRPLASAAVKAHTRARRAVSALQSMQALLGESSLTDPGLRTSLLTSLKQVSALVARARLQLEQSKLVLQSAAPSVRVPRRVSSVEALVPLTEKLLGQGSGA